MSGLTKMRRLADSLNLDLVKDPGSGLMFNLRDRSTGELLYMAPHRHLDRRSSLVVNVNRETEAIMQITAVDCRALPITTVFERFIGELDRQCLLPFHGLEFRVEVGLPHDGRHFVVYHHQPHNSGLGTASTELARFLETDSGLE